MRTVKDARVAGQMPMPLGDDDEPRKGRWPLPERITRMHRLYGRHEGQICGTCQHMIMFKQASRWYKCDLNMGYVSRATDWGVSWPACGRWERG